MHGGILRLSDRLGKCQFGTDCKSDQFGKTDWEKGRKDSEIFTVDKERMSATAIPQTVSTYQKIFLQRTVLNVYVTALQNHRWTRRFSSSASTLYKTARSSFRTLASSFPRLQDQLANGTFQFKQKIFFVSHHLTSRTQLDGKGKGVSSDFIVVRQR